MRISGESIQKNHWTICQDPDYNQSGLLHNLLQHCYKQEEFK